MNQGINNSVISKASDQITVPDILDSKSATNLQAFITQNGLKSYGRSVNSAVTAITGSFNPVKLEPTNQFASGLTWDPVNYRFIATTKGYYIVCVCVGYSSFDGEEYDAMIYKNGALYSVAATNASFSETTVQYSDLVPLDGGDYVEFYTMHSSGSTRNVQVSNTNLFFSITKI